MLAFALLTLNGESGRRLPLFNQHRQSQQSVKQKETRAGLAFLQLIG